MVSTRSRKKDNETLETPRENDDANEAPESESAVAAGDDGDVESGKRKTRSGRLLRKRVGDELRSKSTGLGIAVEATTAVNKKIKFGDDDDDDIASPAVEDADDSEKQREDPEDDDDNEDDDDDDAVEEVQGSAAAEKIALEQLAEEQATARAANLTKKPTRKRKSRLTDGKQGIADASMFDDEFFQQIDKEREEELKNRKSKAAKQNELKTGRHTTFVVSGSDGTIHGGLGSSLTPKAVGHNIEVVVLGTGGDERDATSAAMLQDDGTEANEPLSLEARTGRSLLLDANTEEPSDEVLLYSRRGLLADGSVPLSSKQLHKMKKAGHKSSSNDSTWQRSKKMRVVAYGSRKQAKAAAHFVTRPKR